MFKLIAGLIAGRGVSEPPSPALRGRIEVDFERCALDAACVEACPADAIRIERGPEGARFTLDHGNCVFCGLCEEACGAGALRHGGKFELAVRRRADLLTEGLFGSAPPALPLRCAPDGEQAPAQDLARSLAVRVIDAGDCGGCLAEVASALGPVHDLARLGIELVSSPRQADVLLVTGPVTRAMEHTLRAAHAAMPAPRRVAATGACAISGGIYQRGDPAPGAPGEAHSAGIAGIPVDLWIPGCPPRPQALAQALLVLTGRASPKQRAASWSGALR